MVVADDALVWYALSESKPGEMQKGLLGKRTDTRVRRSFVPVLRILEGHYLIVGGRSKWGCPELKNDDTPDGPQLDGFRPGLNFWAWCEADTCFSH